jgi:hypothetical protein
MTSAFTPPYVRSRQRQRTMGKHTLIVCFVLRERGATLVQTENSFPSKPQRPTTQLHIALFRHQVFSGLFQDATQAVTES